jgi:hypothetical protein
MYICDHSRVNGRKLMRGVSGRQTFGSSGVSSKTAPLLLSKRRTGGEMEEEGPFPEDIF